MYARACRAMEKYICMRAHAVQEKYIYVCARMPCKKIYIYIYVCAQMPCKKKYIYMYARKCRARKNIYMYARKCRARKNIYI